MRVRRFYEWVCCVVVSSVKDTQLCIDLLAYQYKRINTDPEAGSVPCWRPGRTLILRSLFFFSFELFVEAEEAGALMLDLIRFTCFTSTNERINKKRMY